MKIKSFDTKNSVLLIAEIGNNHEGDINVAIKMVEAAAQAGVDAVKFQTFQTAYFVNPDDTERVERMKKFELTAEQFSQLAGVAHDLGLLFISTPLDMPSVAVLKPLVDAYKIASGDITFEPLIREVNKQRKPTILSTGASTLVEVENAYNWLTAEDHKKNIVQENLAILHCVSCYPAPSEAINLNSLDVLKNNFKLSVGYSDHTLGINTCLLAVAKGAEIIEKHFTLDKNFSNFRDHQLSSDPDELKRLVEQVRATEAILGKAQKKLQMCEEEMLIPIRRSIVAARELSKGNKVEAKDIMWMRPGNGIKPGNEPLVLNKTLKRNIEIGQAILLDDIE